MKKITTLVVALFALMGGVKADEIELTITDGQHFAISQLDSYDADDIVRFYVTVASETTSPGWGIGGLCNPDEYSVKEGLNWTCQAASATGEVNIYPYTVKELQDNAGPKGTYHAAGYTIQTYNGATLTKITIESSADIFATRQIREFDLDNVDQKWGAATYDADTHVATFGNAWDGAGWWTGALTGYKSVVVYVVPTDVNLLLKTYLPSGSTNTEGSVTLAAGAYYVVANIDGLDDLQAILIQDFAATSVKLLKAYASTLSVADEQAYLNTNPYYVAATIGTAEWATYTPKADIKIEDATAYVVTKVADGYATQAAVTEVPANNPVLLNGTAGTHIFEVISSATAIDTNLLEVSDTDIAANGEYVLANGTNGVGFYPATSGTIAAGKAYLPASVVSTAKGFIGFDATTGIDAVHSSQFTVHSDAPMYNLAGQRVNAQYKGVVIQNGVKVIRK